MIAIMAGFFWVSPIALVRVAGGDTSTNSVHRPRRAALCEHQHRRKLYDISIGSWDTNRSFLSLFAGCPMLPARY